MLTALALLVAVAAPPAGHARDRWLLVAGAPSDATTARRLLSSLSPRLTTHPQLPAVVKERGDRFVVVVGVCDSPPERDLALLRLDLPGLQVRPVDAVLDGAALVETLEKNEHDPCPHRFSAMKHFFDVKKASSVVVDDDHPAVTWSIGEHRFAQRDPCGSLVYALLVDGEPVNESWLEHPCVDGATVARFALASTLTAGTRHLLMLVARDEKTGAFQAGFVVGVCSGDSHQLLDLRDGDTVKADGTDWRNVVVENGAARVHLRFDDATCSYRR